MSGRLPSVLTAYAAQAAALADWLAAVDLDAPAVLPGWTLRTLLGHVAGGTDGLLHHLGTRAAGPAIAAERYVTAFAPAAHEITAASAEIGASAAGEELIRALRQSVADVDVPDRVVVDGPRGPITALDFARLRLLELVVHADDASRSLPDRPAVTLVRAALADSVRLLAELLAARVPGRSVELRVAPFVAVQAVPGPRHRRGTPPNVVESEPLMWLRLATGRADFASEVASGAVRASGLRADLTSHLPLLR